MTESNYVLGLRRRFILLLERSGLTQLALSKALGVSPSHLCNILAGRRGKRVADKTLAALRRLEAEYDQAGRLPQEGADPGGPVPA